jgi:hypothetical protein
LRTSIKRRKRLLKLLQQRLKLKLKKKNRLLEQ